MLTKPHIINTLDAVAVGAALCLLPSCLAPSQKATNGGTNEQNAVKVMAPVDSVAKSAPQKSGGGEIKADGGGSAESTEQQQQGLFNVQTAGLSTAMVTILALTIWRINKDREQGNTDREWINETEQTRRIDLNGQASISLAKHHIDEMAHIKEDSKC